VHGEFSRDDDGAFSGGRQCQCGGKNAVVRKI
jgi:hypothetical protein